MNEIEMGKLHNRATTGEVLTVDEQMALRSWYESNDEDENLLLNQNGSFPDDERWQKELNDSLLQIARNVGENNKLAQQNEVLRRENDKLRRMVENRLLKEVA